LHRARTYHYDGRALTDRSIASEEKRRLILDAAVRVFARKGFHTCRVGDIAEEAGVAHGLLYHYFSSKDELLETVFREAWGELLAAMRAVEETGEPAPEQLRKVCAILLRTWRDRPEVVTVLVREIARSGELQNRLEDVREAFRVIERIVARGQADGTFRPELDPPLAATIVYGALEEILTAWVLGQLPDGDEEVARAERTVVDVLVGGLAREPARLAS
jgi:TetR/AcrR family transcriptional regulator, fatty acid metabolism regulator protein